MLSMKKLVLLLLNTAYKMLTKQNSVLLQLSTQVNVKKKENIMKEETIMMMEMTVKEKVLNMKVHPLKKSKQPVMREWKRHAPP